MQAAIANQAVSPDVHGIAVLLLIVVALFLFTRDRLPLESSSLIILTILVVGFQIFPYERDGVPLDSAQFLSGFGNEALVAICSLMMIGKALETTGALQPIAMLVSKTWSTRPSLALLLTLVAVAVLSAFINDTPIVVLMIPILVGISLRAKFPVSGVMLPMGLATIIGGMSTTIGTSTNLLVVGIAHDLGVPTIGMFDFVLPAVIVGGAGLLFLWLVAPRLLPDRVLPMADTAPRIFSSQLFVTEDSVAAGKTLSEVLAKTAGQMRVERIQRSESLFLAKLPTVILQPGDRLFVKDTPGNLKHFESLLGATLYNIFDSQHPVSANTPLKAEGQQLAEVVVTRGSPLHRRTLAAARFAASYGLLPLAIHRARAPDLQIPSDLNNIRLRVGDVLLVQGTRDAINALKSSGTMLVLDGTTDLPHTHRANRAFAVLGLVVLIIVTSLALGKALVATGMAEYLAAGFVGIASNWPAPLILSTFILIMALLTNVVSNNAAAVIGTPIAIATAQQLNVDPMPFVLAVLFGANMSFATPFGYQTNLLILSAGGYKFSDFLRVGIPLVIIMWVGFSIVLPLFYNLG